MSDEIGRGVVSFEADASGLKAEMNTTADAVDNLGAKLAQTGADGATALDGISVSATEMSTQATAAVNRFMDSLNRQTISIEGGRVALLEYRAEQLGVTEQAQQYFDRMRAVETQTQAATAAQQQMNAAMTEASADNAFLDSLRSLADTYGLTKTQLLQYQAAQRGLEGESASLIARLSEQEQQTRSAAAAQQQLGDAMTRAAQDNAFLDSLRAQADTYGLTRTELLQYQAAQKGLENESAALIARLSAQEQQTKQAAAAQQQLNDTMTRAGQDNAFLTSLNARANAIGKTTSQLLAEQAAERGLSSEAAGAIAKLKAHEDATAGAGESAEGFGLKTAGARKEVAVMLHELATGNVKNFGGSLLVLGERMDFLGALFSPVSIGIASVVAVIATLGYAALKGAEQQSAFEKALQATGGYAGTSAAAIGVLADQIGALGVPVTRANELLIDVVATGKISGQAIEAVAAASALLAEATGQDAQQIVQKFAEMSGDVADGAAKMSEQYHFLTVAQYDEIKALQEHGDAQGAMKVAADALTASLEGQKIPLGTLPALLHDAASAWSVFWQAAMNAGKPDTPTTHLNDLRAQLAEQESILANGGLQSMNGQDVNLGTDVVQKAIADLKNEINGAEREASSHEYSTERQGYLKQQEQAALDAAKAVDKLSQSFDKNYEKRKSLQDLQEQFTKLFNDPSDPTHQDSRLKGVVQNPNGTFSGGEYDKLVKGINDRNKPSTAVDNATLTAQVKDVQDALKAINTAYQNSETLLEASHNAGTISDADFYQRQRDEIAKTANAQTVQLQREETILKSHKAAGAEQVRINQQIRDADQQLQKVRDDTATKFQKNVTDETNAQKKRQSALDEFKAALNQQVDTQKNTVDIQVAGVGMGSQEAQQMQQLNSLQRSYDQQRTRIAGQMAKVDPQSDQYSLYQSELAALRDANDQAVAITKDGYARMRDAQGNWQNGATQALQNYADSANNIAGQVSSAFADAFRGMEDAFVTFVTTGKISFSSLATSVISDIARMSARAAISGLFNSAVGAASEYFGGAAHFATGGFVAGQGSATSDSIPAMLSNGEYVLKADAVSRLGRSNLDAANAGQAPSRWLHFASGGFVGGGAAQASSASAGMTFQTNVNVAGGGAGNTGTNNALGNQLSRQIETQMKAYLQRENQQGGLLWRIRNGQA